MSPVETLLAKLPGARKAGNGWSARCPAHDDKRASLSIAEGDDGTALVKCHAGCDTSAILSAVRLTLADLFPPKARNGSESSERRIVATYDYQDAEGKLLYQVVRFEPKDFRLRRPDSETHAGWIWNLKGVNRVLYRQLDIQRALKDGDWIFVVEGEKDADNLGQLGLVSTTNPGGAGKWHKRYTETLYGARIAILPDNDEAGQTHARKVASSLQGHGIAIKIVELPDLPPKGDVSDWLAAGGTREKLLALVDAAPAWESLSKPAGKPKISADILGNRPTITITTDEHLVNDQAVIALCQDETIFQRVGSLVRVVRDISPAMKGIRRPLAPRIEVLPAPLLRERLAANARWVKIKETQNAVVEAPAHPPAWCVGALHARAAWDGIRHLEAVVHHPVLRPDGTILFQPGYDPTTGLLYEPTGQSPLMPERPTKADAVSACDLLFEVVADFPFERDVHKAAWLAALLTPIGRFAFTGPAPLFLVDANTRGAGKGLLLDCISKIITGERFTIATYTDDEDELRKRITSLVLMGDRLVLFDNLEGKFGNATLDAALTGTAWKDRLLGVNRMAEAPLYITWFATGNNVAVAADTTRRVCHIRLESPDEKPEERSDFRHPDLLAWVGQNRGKLLAAALTILRAYVVAGRPRMELRAWGSFESWTGLVRSAVVWIGLPDPAKTRVLLQEQADVVAGNMAVVLACWEKLDPDQRGLTATEVIERLQRDHPDSMPDVLTDLKAALEPLLGKLDSRALGNKLRNHRRRIFQGRFIDHAGKQQGAVRWAVYAASEFHSPPSDTHQTHDNHGRDGESGDSGESDSGDCGRSSERADLDYEEDPPF